MAAISAPTVMNPLMKTTLWGGDKCESYSVWGQMWKRNTWNVLIRVRRMGSTNGDNSYVMNQHCLLLVPSNMTYILGFFHTYYDYYSWFHKIIEDRFSIKKVVIVFNTDVVFMNTTQAGQHEFYLTSRL